MKKSELMTPKIELWTLWSTSECYEYRKPNKKILQEMLFGTPEEHCEMGEEFYKD